MGASASIVDQAGFDIVVVYKEQIYRVEVKATTKKNANKFPFMTSRGGVKKMINDTHCDIVCLVDIVGRRCYYMSATDVKHIKTSLYDHEFKDEFLLFTNAVKKVNLKREGVEDELG